MESTSLCSLPWLCGNRAKKQTGPICTSAEIEHIWQKRVRGVGDILLEQKDEMLMFCASIPKTTPAPPHTHLHLLRLLVYSAPLPSHRSRCLPLLSDCQSPRLFTAVFCLYPAPRHLFPPSSLFFPSQQNSLDPSCVSPSPSAAPYPRSLFFYLFFFICLSLAHLRSVYPVWFYLDQKEGTRTGTGSPVSASLSPPGRLRLISSFKDSLLWSFFLGGGCAPLFRLPFNVPHFYRSLFFSFFGSTVIRHMKFRVPFVLFSWLCFVSYEINK